MPTPPAIFVAKDPVLLLINASSGVARPCTSSSVVAVARVSVIRLAAAASGIASCARASLLRVSCSLRGLTLRWLSEFGEYFVAQSCLLVRCLSPACDRPEFQSCQPSALRVQHATATTHAAPWPSGCRSSSCICGTHGVEQSAPPGLSHWCGSLEPVWKQRTWSRWGICSSCREKKCGDQRFGRRV